ncbi:MAG: hypothetical protein GY798_11210, partial [Hyphomicrobiales bacterium]|nr:hypothetical protein [Hyphomicrobiales bacterium]
MNTLTAFLRIALLGIAMLYPAAASARVLYVNQAASSATQDGAGWKTAFKTLQAALGAARAGDEIWVARGTYKPTDGNDRDASFVLVEGVALYGGFGGGETRRGARDWTLNTTILSGDIGLPGDWRDNSFHVVTGANDAVLDGFTIADGAAIRETPERRPRGGTGTPRAQSSDGRPPEEAQGEKKIHITPEIVLAGDTEGSGGGMVNFRAAPVVRNCVFRDNRAMKAGAVYNMTTEKIAGGGLRKRPAAQFENCVFLNNLAVMRGGAMSNDFMTDPTIIKSVFVANSSGGKGGAIYNDFECSPVIRDSVFFGNHAFQGAAIGNDGKSSPVIIGSVITGNAASDLGAGLYQGTGPANDPIVINTIVRDNSAPAGPADVYNWHDDSPQFAGSIIGDQVNAPVATDKIAEVVKRLKARTSKTIVPVVLAAKEFDASAPPVYVNASSKAADPDGKTWASAFRELQAGIDAAAKRESTVWLAAGVYVPSANARDASFELRPGVAVYGGFAGSEDKLDARDWKANVSVLSGQIGTSGTVAKNSYHVVIGANGARLDGVKVTGGNADGERYDAKGGGLINYADHTQKAPKEAPVTGFSMTLANCIFDENRAKEGGAIYSYDRAKVSIENCRFTNNSAEFGGAIVDRIGVVSTMTNVTLEGNKARWSGGAYFVGY